MKNRIADIFRNSKNENMFDTSVIFVNRLTKKVSFFNGITGEFDFITEAVFKELLADKVIKIERCICQGDARYILA